MAKEPILQKAQTNLRNEYMNIVNRVSELAMDTLKHVMEYQQEISAVEETKKKMQASLDNFQCYAYEKRNIGMKKISPDFGEDKADSLTKDELERQNSLDRIISNCHTAREKRYIYEKNQEIELQDQKILKLATDIELSFLELKENFSCITLAASLELGEDRIDMTNPKLFYEITTNNAKKFEELEIYVENQCKKALNLKKELLEIKQTIELDSQKMKVMTYYSLDEPVKTDWNMDLVTDDATTISIRAKIAAEPTLTNMKNIYATLSHDQLSRYMKSNWEHAVVNYESKQKAYKDNIAKNERKKADLEQQIEDLYSTMQEESSSVCKDICEHTKEIIYVMAAEQTNTGFRQDDISLDEYSQESLKTYETELSGDSVSI